LYLSCKSLLTEEEEEGDDMMMMTATAAAVTVTVCNAVRVASNIFDLSTM
jgi:hypothetical protein